MVRSADRLNAQSGADGGTSSAGLGRQICAPGSELDCSTVEWGAHPPSAIASATDSRRGIRSQANLQVIPEW
jgi:hypothetical protein